MKDTVLNRTKTVMLGDSMWNCTKSICCRGQRCSGQKWMQVQTWREATGNQKMCPGCPVQGSCRTGCSTGSTGSGSGSTAATAEHTGGKKQTQQ